MVLAQMLDAIQHLAGGSVRAAIDTGGEKQPAYHALLETRQKHLGQIVGCQRRARQIAAGAERAVGTVPFALAAHQRAKDWARPAIRVTVGSDPSLVPGRLLRRVALAALAEAITCIEARRRGENVEFLVEIHRKLRIEN